jgi:hypothetical protein
VDVDLSQPEPRTVRLAPAGDLVVRLGAGWEDLEGARVLCEGRDVATQDVRRRAEVRFEGIAAGAYAVRARRADRHPVAIGAPVDVFVRRGETAVVALPSPEPESVPLVRLSGTLTVHPAWEGTVGLRALPVEASAGAPLAYDVSLRAAEPLSGGGRRCAWTTEPLPPGAYTVRMDAPIDVARRFVVGPRGTHDAHIDVGPPLSVAVAVIDEEDGSPADVPDLTWCASGDGAAFPTGAAPGPGPGLFRLRVPAGRVTLNVSPHHERGDRPRYTLHEDVEILRDGQRVEVLAPRAQGVTLRLRNGPRAVERSDLRVERLDGPGEVFCHGGSVQVERPGVYDLLLPDVDGFEGPQVRVEVPAGAWVEHTVDLTPPR